MSTLSFLVFLSKILQIHYGMVRRRLRTLKEICCSVNKLMLQLVLCLMVVSHLCLISQYCTYHLTVNDPSSSHAGASELTLSKNDSDQDCQMDVSPPNDRSTSSGIGLQPFGQSFIQTSQGAESFHPSMLSQLCYGPVVTYCMVYYYTKRATLARLLANEGPAIYVVHLNRYFVIPL